jgi:hypothetical protein
VDLVQTLSSQLGVSPDQAQGLAGEMLGVINGAVHNGAGAEAASQLQSAIPELKNWMQTAAAHQGVAPPAGGSGDLLGMLGSILAGAQGAGAGNLGTQLQESGAAAAMSTVLAKYGVKPEQLSAVAPVIGQFLEHRMGADGAQSILNQVLPMFTGGAQGQSQGNLGGLASVLGGLFGKK